MQAYDPTRGGAAAPSVRCLWDGVQGCRGQRPNDNRATVGFNAMVLEGATVFRGQDLGEDSMRGAELAATTNVPAHAIAAASSAQASRQMVFTHA